MAPELRKRSKDQKPTTNGEAAALRKRKAADTNGLEIAKKLKTASISKSNKPASRPAKKGADKSSTSTSKSSKPVPKPALKKAAENPKDLKQKAESHDSDEDVDPELQALAAGIDPNIDDESDVASDSEFQPGQDVGKIPDSLKTKKIGDATSGKPGVIYVGHIPHGFYEHEMRQYFSQWGPITNLRLSRNKKTGKSKHYAFIEFAEESTAEIVAKTMDNYLLFGHILKCKLVSEERLHKDVWKGANHRFKTVPRNKIERNHLNKPLPESTWSGRVSKEAKRRATRAEKLKELGYEYEAPELKKAVSQPLIAGDSSEEQPKQIDAPPTETEPVITANDGPKEEPAKEQPLDSTPSDEKSKKAKPGSGKNGKTKKRGVKSTS